MLTKKHFIQEARRLIMIADDVTRGIQVDAFCQMAKANNPRFDSGKFKRACTPTARKAAEKPTASNTGKDGRMKRRLNLTEDR